MARRAKTSPWHTGARGTTLGMMSHSTSERDAGRKGRKAEMTEERQAGRGRGAVLAPPISAAAACTTVQTATPGAKTSRAVVTASAARGEPRDRTQSRESNARVTRVRGHGPPSRRGGGIGRGPTEGRGRGRNLGAVARRAERSIRRRRRMKEPRVGRETTESPDPVTDTRFGKGGARRLCDERRMKKGRKDQHAAVVPDTAAQTEPITAKGAPRTAGPSTTQK